MNDEKSKLQGEVFMTNNEKTTGVPIDDDDLEMAAGGITLPLTEEDIRNIKPVPSMDAIDTNALKINLDQGVVEVGAEHNGPSCAPITGKPLVKTLLKSRL